MNNKKNIILVAIIGILLIVGGIIVFFGFKKNDDRIYAGWQSTSGEYWVFKSNKDWYWYKSANDLNDNYYFGNMEVLRGNAAIEELGISYTNVLKVISSNEISVGDIYALKMHPTKLISGGVDKSNTKLSDDFVMKMLFVVVDDENAQAYNYTTGNTLYLTRK